MADFPSAADLYAIGRDRVRTTAKNIDPATIDVVGSDANLFVGVASEMAFAVVLQLMYAVNRLLLDGAEGDDLDRYALDRYGLARKGASPSVGTVRVFRSVATAGAGSIATGTILTALNGVQFMTTTTITFGASALSATGNVRAVDSGAQTKVGANAIRKFNNASVLFDSSLQVTNDIATAGGEDAEDDPTFRARIRDFWNTARRGTLAAIEFGALTVAGVVSAQAIETLDENGAAARVVNLYVADGSGNANQALADLVSAALEDYRAGGIAVLVTTSAPQILNITLHLVFQAGVDTAALKENVLGAVVEFVNSLPVNGTFTRAALYSVLQRYAEDGLLVSDDTIQLPTGDVVPDAGKTIRTTEANVTFI
jgi:uncharacterized phage protein gp47/JayE